LALKLIIGVLLREIYRGNLGETMAFYPTYNVNPGLINNGLLIRGGTPPIVIIQYLNGTPPIKRPRGLLIQG
jgi:hypothetical protein